MSILLSLAGAVTSAPTISQPKSHNIPGVVVRDVVEGGRHVDRVVLEDLGLNVSYGGFIKDGSILRRDLDQSFAPYCTNALGAPPHSADCTYVAARLQTTSTRNVTLAPCQCLLVSYGTCSATACNRDPCSPIDVEISDWAMAVSSISSECINDKAAAGNYYQNDPGIQISVAQSGIAMTEYEEVTC